MYFRRRRNFAERRAAYIFLEIQSEFPSGETNDFRVPERTGWDEILFMYVRSLKLIFNGISACGSCDGVISSECLHVVMKHLRGIFMERRSTFILSQKKWTDGWCLKLVGRLFTLNNNTTRSALASVTEIKYLHTWTCSWKHRKHEWTVVIQKTESTHRRTCQLRPQNR